MNAEWFFAWWNLIFIVPFLLALLYVGVYLATGITFGDADADMDHDLGVDSDADAGVDTEVHADIDGDAHIDADADADVDADAHMDADADGDLHSESDADAESAGDSHASFLHGLMGLVGLGRVPVSIVLMVLLIAWGVIGFLTNVMLWPSLHSGAAIAPISLSIAAVGSVFFARIIATTMARWLPTYETYARRRHDLLGAVGEAILPIDHETGSVAVRDANSDLFHVACRVHKGQPPVAKGAKVRLIAYNGREGVFYVTLYDSAAASRPATT